MIHPDAQEWYEVHGTTQGRQARHRWQKHKCLYCGIGLYTVRHAWQTRGEVIPCSGATPAWVEIEHKHGQQPWFVPVNKPCDVCGVVQEKYYLCQPCADVMFADWCKNVRAGPELLQSNFPSTAQDKQIMDRKRSKAAYDKRRREARSAHQPGQGQDKVGTASV